MSKLKIALVVESFPTFSETFITNKVLYLCNQGHQVTVIRNSLGHNDSLVNLYQLHSISNLRIIEPAIPKYKQDWFLLVLLKPMVFIKTLLSLSNFKSTLKEQLYLNQFQKNKFDIIHFEFSGIGIAYQSILKKINCVKIVSCRGTAEKVKPLNNVERQNQLIKLFSSVQAIHCVSDDMEKTIRQYNKTNTKTFINRPSIDSNVFKRKHEYPNNNDKIKLLSIGRFTFQKGYTVGLQVAHQLKNSGVSFEWLIVGDGPTREEIIFGIHALNLSNEIKLLGKKNRDEVIELYNDCDIFFLPSVYEGIANVVLEAMAMELPVVSTKSGGLEEVIEHEFDGMLADIYDANNLLQCLISLSKNFELRKKLGNNARVKILNQFTLERQIIEFEKQYSSLLNNGM